MAEEQSTQEVIEDAQIAQWAEAHIPQEGAAEQLEDQRKKKKPGYPEILQG